MDNKVGYVVAAVFFRRRTADYNIVDKRIVEAGQLFQNAHQVLRSKLDGMRFYKGAFVCLCQRRAAVGHNHRVSAAVHIYSSLVI
ncbi:hypothetical protein SDC9_176631 [bioreactor metagenome]|uniref:Uncharacterized protein n=1 Tax=bioreactor metagenome TaxID=1076179 RepID=A0A645GSC7_9ZZZZ